MSVTTPRHVRPPARRVGDRVFSGTARGAGIAILAILAGVAVFLLTEAWPAVVAPAGAVPGGEGLTAYIAPLVFGTLLAATLALAVATPLAVGIALFITHYAPRRLAAGLGYLVDLLAAGAEHRLRALGILGRRAGIGRSQPLARGAPRVRAAVRRPRVVHGPDDAGRGRRARGDGPRSSPR